jgi:hypothetical protein
VTGVAISEGAADGQRYSLPSPRPSSVCPQIRAGRKHPISPLRACARARTRCSRPAGGLTDPRCTAFTGCALRRHVFVFHRGARRWAADTFDVSGRIRTREPIQQAMALSLLSVGANQSSSAVQWTLAALLTRACVHSWVCLCVCACECARACVCVYVGACACASTQCFVSTRTACSSARGARACSRCRT